MNYSKDFGFADSAGDFSSFDLQAIPYKVLISMEQQHERRSRAFNQFSALGLDVEWKIPVKIEDIEWGKMPGGYKGQPKYASQTLTLIEVFEEAKRRKVDCFMLFEDDVVFHPHFMLLLPQIIVPEDWKFIYVGGRNGGKKQYISRGIVKSNFISDLHAVIIRSDMIESLKRVLLDSKMNTHWADARIASLHKRHPAYLCRPNLIWQSVHTNDSGVGEAYSNYYEDGTVKSGQGD